MLLGIKMYKSWRMQQIFVWALGPFCDAVRAEAMPGKDEKSTYQMDPAIVKRCMRSLLILPKALTWSL